MNVIDKLSAIKKLKSGAPIIFQTDTLPAIGCLPQFPRIIYEVKKRDREKPLILMGAEKEQLIDYVHESAKNDYEKIADRFWPGALTIVMPVSDKNNKICTSGNLTLGLRIPNSNMARSLIRETGPLLTSSANISGSQGSLTAQEIGLELPSVDILGPVPWDKCSGNASTIISWIKHGEWAIIRKGQLSFGDL